jgi:hypothetical protein
MLQGATLVEAAAAAAAVVVLIAMWVAWAYSVGEELTHAAVQHAALLAGGAAFDGAPLVQYRPLTELLDETRPPLLRPSDGWEPQPGWVAALDATEHMAHDQAERLVIHEMPFVWRGDPAMSRTADAWTEWLMRVVTSESDPALKSEARAMTGQVQKLDPPYVLGERGGWQLMYSKAEQRNTTLHDMLLMRLDPDLQVEGPPPYYFDGQLDGRAADLPMVAFAGLPGSGNRGKQLRASGRTVRCVDHTNSGLGGSSTSRVGALGVLLRLGFTPVTYATHFDGNDNWIVSLAGSRRVILIHPIEGIRKLRPVVNQSSSHYRQCEERGLLRELPRDMQQSIVAIAAELGPGDSLHVPAGWLHYLEIATSNEGGRDLDDHRDWRQNFWLSMAQFCEADRPVSSS